MSKNEKTVLEIAKTAFSDNAQSLQNLRNVSQAEVGRAVKKLGAKVAGKTVNNIFAGRFPSELGNFAAIAEYFDVPLWVMFIPKLDKKLLEKPGLDQLVRLVNEYMDCSEEHRASISSLAHAFSQASKLK